MTINNPTAVQLDHSTMETNLKANGVSFAVWQVERVSTTHIQAYVRFKNSVRLTKLRSTLPGCRAFQRKGTEMENITYCSKPESRIAGPWEFGVRVLGQGSRSDLTTLTTMVRSGATRKKIAEDMPEMVVRYHRGISTLMSWQSPPTYRVPKVLVFWGPTGTGKTRKAYETYPEIFFVPTPTTRLWFDGYLQQEEVLFDDFRHSWVNLSMLLRLTDRYPMTVEVKGGTVAWNPTTIVFTSDTHPRDWFDGADSSQLMRRITEIVHFNSP